MPHEKDEEKSIRELLLGVHEKLDAMRVASRRILRDRLRDRDMVQRHGRRISNLEHQVALLTATVPGVTDWRPNPSDLPTGEHTAVEPSDVDLDELEDS